MLSNCIEEYSDKVSKWILNYDYEEELQIIWIINEYPFRANWQGKEYKYVTYKNNKDHS